MGAGFKIALLAVEVSQAGFQLAYAAFVAVSRADGLCYRQARLGGHLRGRAVQLNFSYANLWISDGEAHRGDLADLHIGVRRSKDGGLDALGFQLVPEFLSNVVQEAAFGGKLA